jgi:hypothetical protein
MLKTYKEHQTRKRTAHHRTPKRTHHPSKTTRGHQQQQRIPANIDIYIKRPKLETFHFIHENTQATTDTNHIHSDNTEVTIETKVRNILTPLTSLHP